MSSAVAATVPSRRKPGIHPDPWTEYNPDNESVTLTYQVGYWA